MKAKVTSQQPSSREDHSVEDQLFVNTKKQKTQTQTHTRPEPEKTTVPRKQATTEMEVEEDAGTAIPATNTTSTDPNKLLEAEAKPEASAAVVEEEEVDEEEEEEDLTKFKVIVNEHELNCVLDYINKATNFQDPKRQQQTVEQVIELYTLLSAKIAAHKFKRDKSTLLQVCLEIFRRFVLTGFV